MHRGVNVAGNGHVPQMGRIKKRNENIKRGNEVVFPPVSPNVSFRAPSKADPQECRALWLHRAPARRSQAATTR